MPLRHNARAGMQATQSIGFSGFRQNKHITVIDPTKNIKRVVENSAVNNLTGGITTPSRKRSFGKKESLRNITTDPFSIKNLKDKSKQKEEFDPKADEEEHMVKGSNSGQPAFKPAPLINIRQPPISPVTQRSVPRMNLPQITRQSKPIPLPVV